MVTFSVKFQTRTLESNRNLRRKQAVECRKSVTKKSWNAVNFSYRTKLKNDMDFVRTALFANLNLS